MRTIRPLLQALLLALMLALSAGAGAQAQPAGLPGLGNANAPLEIEADRGLELYQDRNMVVAKGNVVARQGEVILRADIVSATYEEGPGGQRRIRRLDAVGNVRITTGRERLYGDHVTYDLARELMVATGRDMRIEAENQTIRAERSLEFWGAEQRAVARGNASVTQEATSLRADVIEALLKPKGAKTAPDRAAPGGFAGAQGTSVDRVNAWGGVVIKTASEIVEGDRGEYDVPNQVAKLSGNVRISRGRNQLNGEEAIVNLKTGVSRLTGGRSGRVRTILFPDGNLDAPAPQVSRRTARTEGTAAQAKSREAPPATDTATRAKATGSTTVPIPRPRPPESSRPPERSRPLERSERRLPFPPKRPAGGP